MAGSEIAAAAIIGTLAAGGSIAAAQMNKPKLPGAPKLPDSAKRKAPDTAALDAQRSKRLAATSKSTILTGPQGLGNDASTDRKSLLGY